MSPWSINDYKKALALLRQRGFMMLFAGKPGQSFYQWARQEIGCGDPEMDFVATWEISNLMAEQRDAYYGKLFRDYILIEIGFMPVFLSVYPLGDARELYWSGNLSRKAWEVFGLLEEGPRTTVALNQATGARDRKSRAETEKALAELMRARVACRAGALRSPVRSWDVALYDLLARWLPEGIAEEAAALTRDYALERLFEKFYEAIGGRDENAARRFFRLSKSP